jgi:hypothetical protein
MAQKIAGLRGFNSFVPVNFGDIVTRESGIEQF